MKLTAQRKFIRKHQGPIVFGIISSLVVLGLLWWRLGSLVPGLSPGEQAVASRPLSIQNLSQHPLYLPLEIVRFVVFHVIPQHGTLATRLPNTVFGGLAILTVAAVLRSWHGTRTAIFATVLFATGAWTLHSSRLASYDVLYLWSAPTLLLIQVALQKRAQQTLVFYGSLILWGLCLYIPGLVWLIILSAIRQRAALKSGWQHFAAIEQRACYVLAGLIWLPLLIIDFIRNTGEFKLWLGLPTDFATPVILLKQMALVPVHLLIHGPRDPERWLGQAPLFDIFTLLICVLGLYFYARHWQASRSLLLGSFLVLGGLLVGLGGPVSLSFLVPILYMIAATGIAYLLRGWLKTFPINPIARGVGIGLVSLAVLVSCIYNLRAYFVAWPHNSSSVAVFRTQP